MCVYIFRNVWFQMSRKMKKQKLIEKKQTNKRRHTHTHIHSHNYYAKEEERCVNKIVWSLIFSGNKININWSFTVVFTAIRDCKRKLKFKFQEKKIPKQQMCHIHIARTIADVYAVGMCNLLSWYVMTLLSLLVEYCSMFRLTAHFFDCKLTPKLTICSALVVMLSA